jgi:hypothetical protein
LNSNGSLGTGGRALKEKFYGRAVLNRPFCRLLRACDILGKGEHARAYVGKIYLPRYFETAGRDARCEASGGDFDCIGLYMQEGYEGPV